MRHIGTLPLDVTLPESQVTGHGVQSLNGVMIQSLLQGSWQGRTVLGRGPSGHLGKKCIMGTLITYYSLIFSPPWTRGGHRHQ